MNVQQYAGMTVSDLTAALLDRGWQKLGSGAAAFCFGKMGSGRVVKIVCGDTGQEAAVDLFEAHPEIAAFPRVYSWAWLAEPGCFAVEMERLREQPDSYVDDDGRIRIFRSEARTYGPMDELLGDEAAALIRERAAELGEEIDLHADNLMLREDGTVVAVDPFYVSASHALKDSVEAVIECHSTPEAAHA